MKPMLAHRFNDHRKKIVFPCHVQPKLDGTRALYFRGKFQSRGRPNEEGDLWHDSVLEHINCFLRPTIPDNIVLDGELYKHGWKRQKINGAISVVRQTPNTQTRFIEYHVFDLLDLDNEDMPFHERTILLAGLLGLNPKSPAKYVFTQTVYDHIQADYFYRHFRADGYEGLMYRDSSAPYGTAWTCSNKENRWPTLLKRKLWIDEEFICLGVEEGSGKNTGLVGALQFRSSTGHIFTAGSGLSDFERREYMDRPPIGHTVTIKYESISEKGIPLQPSIVQVHES